MPRYVKGDHAVETSVPSEGVELRAQGYRQEKARTKRVQDADAARAGRGKTATPQAVNPTTPKTGEKN